MDGLPLEHCSNLLYSHATRIYAHWIRTMGFSEIINGIPSGPPSTTEPKYCLLKLRIVQQKEIVTPSRGHRAYRLADMTEETLGLIESIVDKYKKEGEL